MWPVCGDLVRRGWAVWNLEYRRIGLGSEGGWPHTFDDVRAGIERLRTLHAPLDLERVVAVGHSAGGQLALWAAAQDLGLRTAVSQAGVTDLTLAARMDGAGALVTAFLGGTPDEVPDRYAAASPAALLPIGVPLLVVHGTADATIPVAVSETFAEKARLAGDEVELARVEGAGHMDHLDPEHPMWRLAADWIDRAVG